MLTDGELLLALAAICVAVFVATFWIAIRLERRASDAAAVRHFEKTFE